MNWEGITSVMILSTFKFMFAPFAGPPFNLSFFETYLSCVIGGTTSAAIFFLFSKVIIYKLNRFKHNRLKFKNKKKVFTKTNKFIVKIKMKSGILGICFWAPFFLSVPLGSAIVAKFYGKKRGSFFLVFIGMNINAFIMTSIVYLIF